MSPIEYFTAPGHPYNCAQSVALGTGHPELEEEYKMSSFKNYMNNLLAFYEGYFEHVYHA